MQIFRQIETFKKFVSSFGSWVLLGPGSSRVLGPLGSWVLEGPGSSRVLGPRVLLRVLGHQIPVCLPITAGSLQPEGKYANFRHALEQIVSFNSRCHVLTLVVTF